MVYPCLTIESNTNALTNIANIIGIDVIFSSHSVLVLAPHVHKIHVIHGMNSCEST